MRRLEADIVVAPASNDAQPDFLLLSILADLQCPQPLHSILVSDIIKYTDRRYNIAVEVPCTYMQTMARGRNAGLPAVNM